MHFHLNTLSLCALTALAAACVPAHAGLSTSTASIEQFQFRLVDLDLNDGIAPSISFGLDQRSVETVGAGRTESLAGSGTVSIVAPSGSASGTVSDSALLSSTTFNYPLPVDGALHSYRNDSNRLTEFTLSPNTRLIFTAVGKVAQQLDGHFYNALSRIGMHGALFDENGTMDEFNKKFYTGTGADSVALYATLSSDALERKGSFSLEAHTILWEPQLPIPTTPPVPEPSTYAMLLAGTFMVGAVARRRRRAAARAA